MVRLRDLFCVSMSIFVRKTLKNNWIMLRNSLMRLLRHSWSLLFCLTIWNGGLFAQVSVEPLSPEALQKLEALYKHLHQNPELSYYEHNTAARLAQEMRTLGLEVTEGVGGTGVVAVLKNGEGPTVMVRTDMDALPIIEKTGAPYASRVRVKTQSGEEVGVMHACGHDIHMTVWVGTAKKLLQERNRWRGTVVFIAQPAEERGGGAKAMLEDGLYERFPLPDYVIALHVNSQLPVGKISYVPGYAMANVESMDITVFGKGGHGAYPHTTIDPIVLSAKIIMNLQTIVSREIAPIDPAVVTVGSIHGGTKHNIIPDRVHMQLTLRSYSDEVRHALVDKIRRICKGEAIAAGLPDSLHPVITTSEFTPAVYNDPKLVQTVVDAFKARYGEENVLHTKPVMGGEDFSHYGRTKERIPIFMFGLGVVNPEFYESCQQQGIAPPSAHSPFFLPDYKPSIRMGIDAMSTAVMTLLHPQ